MPRRQKSHRLTAMDIIQDIHAITGSLTEQIKDLEKRLKILEESHKLIHVELACGESNVRRFLLQPGSTVHSLIEEAGINWQALSGHKKIRVNGDSSHENQILKNGDMVMLYNKVCADASTDMTDIQIEAKYELDKLVAQLMSLGLLETRLTGKLNGE